MKYTALLVLSAAIWGSSYTVSKIGIMEISPLFFTAFRFLIGVLVIGILQNRRLREKIKREDIFKSAKLGAILFLGYALFSIAILYTTVSNSGFFVSMSVVMVPFMAFFMNKSPIPKGTYPGIALCLVGLYLLGLQGGHFSLHFGDILALLSAVMYALHMIFTARYVKTVDTMVLAVLQMSFVFLYSIVAACFFEDLPNIGEFGFVAWGTLLYAGILATGVCYIIQCYGQKYVSESRAGLIFASEPVFAVCVAFIVLGERLSTAGIIGGALVVGGVVISEIINFKEDSSKVSSDQTR